MARQHQRLTVRGIASLRDAGYHCDGGGLYVQVAKSGSKSWVFRFSRDGKTRDMGLGSLLVVSLAQARERAASARRLLLDGTDPIEARVRARQEARLAQASPMTFAACVEAFVAGHRAGWRNAKHAAQWRSTLTTYANPVLGTLPVQSINTAHVVRVLEPLWMQKTETASRLRGRIEVVLDWAAVRGYRTGENPARWRGHLDQLLPARSKVRRVVHHAALSYAAVPDFMRKLREQQGVAAQALEFQILVAARTGETIAARWEEFDFDAAVWTIPGDRMKAGRIHRVPLSSRAMEIVRAMKAFAHSPFVFPGVRAGCHLSNMAMLQLLKRMGQSGITAHGFRSSFRDWVAEATAFPREVAEMALAHTVRDKTEAAYFRGDLFVKRRELMQAWDDYCSSASHDVAALRQVAA